MYVFLKDCMSQYTDIQCPEKNSLFNNIALHSGRVDLQITKWHLWSVVQ